MTSRSRLKNWLNSQHLTAFLIALLIPTLFVATVPHHAATWKPMKVTRTRLILLRSKLRQYVKDYSKPPESMAELRLYSAAKGMDLETYDGFGQRFEYVKLDDANYFLRSFGNDGLQNTLATQNDYNFMTWNLEEGLGLVYRYDQAAQFQLYPAALLLGAHSPNQLWQSRIFLDKSTGDRRLIVRHLRKNHLYMIAPHDRVEEYLWAPNSYQIVYTATSSRRYRDGIYLWNLQDDTVVNLLDLASEEDMAISKEKGYWLAIAGINVARSTLYAYVEPRASLELDPKDFYSGKSVVAFRIPEEGRPKRVKVPAEERRTASRPLTRKISLQDAFYNIGAGSTSQQAWLNLDLGGPLEGMLHEWQEFSVNEADTPLFAYCLWYLSILYGDAAGMIERGQPKEAKTLRTFGLEISNALANFEHSPAYLRGMAVHHYRSYMESTQLPYRISQISL